MRSIAGTVAIALTAISVSGSATRQGPALTPATPAERLTIALLVVTSASELYEPEERRLLEICDTFSAACFRRHFVSDSRQVAVLHFRPDAASPVLGALHLVRLLRREGTISLGLDFESIDSKGGLVPWIDDLGDFGYGYYLSGVRVRGSWIELRGPQMPTAWLEIGTQELTAQVMPLKGQIVELRGLRATQGTGARTSIRPGAYVILGSSAAAVMFRAEVDSDMACGEDVKRPRVMPLTWRAPPAEFFDADGSPRFEVKYTKGC